MCDEVPAWLKTWEGDGSLRAWKLPRWRCPQAAGRARRVFAEVPPKLKMCSCSPIIAVSRLAFEHLKERGFRHLLSAGFNGADYSDERRESLPNR